MAERLAGDQEVVSTNWFAEPFKRCTNPSCVLGVFWGEVQNLKRTVRGTYRVVSDHQMQVYLDEFVFQFNRRRTPMAAIQTLLGIGSRLPTTYEEVKDPGLVYRS